MPCYFSDGKERLALIKVLAEEKRGIVECALPLSYGDELAMQHVDEFSSYALQTGVTCSLSPVLQSPLFEGLWRRLLDRFEEWQAKGAPIFAQSQVRPLDMTIQLSEGSAILSKTPHFRAVFELPVAERIKAFQDPNVRANLRREVGDNERVKRLVVKHVHSPGNEKYLNRSVGDIARDEGKNLFDAFVDIALPDGLKTEFALTGLIHADTQAVVQILEHPAIHIGSADAGAHINQFCGAGDSCYLFEKFVRTDKLMSIERAVQRLTSDLAKGFGIADRGELSAGKFADIVIFDPDTIARGEETFVHDVPGGSGRYVRRPTGVHQVVVNGQLLVNEGNYTAARPGRLV